MGLALRVIITSEPVHQAFAPRSARVAAGPEL
jgi:hypothetical protein